MIRHGLQFRLLVAWWCWDCGDGGLMPLLVVGWPVGLLWNPAGLIFNWRSRRWHAPVCRNDADWGIDEHGRGLHR